MADDAATLAALAAATTGEGTPDRVRVRRQSRAAIACQVGALAAACVFAAWTFVLLATIAARPSGSGASEAVTLEVVSALKWMGLSLIGCIALVSLSQFFNRVDASAAGGHLQLGDGP